MREVPLRFIRIWPADRRGPSCLYKVAMESVPAAVEFAESQFMLDHPGFDTDGLAADVSPLGGHVWVEPLPAEPSTMNTPTHKEKR